jgi:tRNA 2-thiouridine synthesizing protein E
MLEFEDRVIDTDAQGYLQNSADWSEALAPILAEQEGITLTGPHWEVVHFVRAFYQEFNTSPAIRMLVKVMAQKYGGEKGNSRYPENSLQNVKFSKILCYINVGSARMHY